MRRLTSLLLTLLLMAPVAIVAQEQHQPLARFRGGLAAGINASQVDGDGYDGYHRLNFVGGVWVMRPLTERITWRLDIRYIGKGSVRYGKLSGVRHRLYEMELHYLELPVSFEYHFAKRWSAGLGLSAAYLMSARERNAYGERVRRNGVPFRKYDIAAQAILSFAIANHWHLRAEASFTFVPIRAKPGDVITTYRYGQVNRLLQLCLEYEI